MLRPKEVVCKWVDAFNNHDVEAIVSLYHDNATNHQVTNDPVIGIDAIREMFTTEFATAVSERLPSSCQQRFLENVSQDSFSQLFG